MSLKVASGLFVLCFMAHAIDASACSFARPVPLLPAPIFSEAPDEEVLPPSEVKSSVTRGDPSYEDSCSDLGIINIQIKPAEWEDLPLFGRALDIGYQFELVTSSITGEEYTGLPAAAVSPPSAADGYYEFTIAWIDGVSTAQEPMHLTLRVYAVNRWGMRSEPVTVHVQDPGRRGVPEQ